MNIGRTGCKYCGSTNCYGECVTQVRGGYHSKCQHCGSNYCDLTDCSKKAWAKAWEAKKAQAVEWELHRFDEYNKPLPKGELIGHRVWRIATVRTTDPDLVEVGTQLAIPYAIVLQSMNGALWPGPVMHADEKPRRYNSNGIYVLRSEKYKYDNSAPVSGIVALYGHVAEHADGYRAEHAMIRSLTLHVRNITEHLSQPEPGQKNTLGK